MVQMFALYSGRHVVVPREVHQHSGSILGSVNLCKIFRQIFEDQGRVVQSPIKLTQG